MKKTLLFLFSFVLIAGVVFATASYFNDLEPGSYYEDAANEMYQKGLITGYEDGTFGPHDPLTRAQLATIFSRYDEHLHNTLKFQYGVEYICPPNNTLNCTGGGVLGSGCRNNDYLNWAYDACDLVYVENPPADTPSGTGLVTYTARNFTFEYPIEWEVSDPEYSTLGANEYLSVTFYVTGEENKALLECPVRETGFEVWEFETSTRSFEKDGITYEVVLNLGTAMYPEDEDINTILMRDENDFFNSCWIMSEGSVTEETDEIFTHIYESVR
jgi:hypothetical protein